jgi:hypothetical protein
LGLGGTRNTNPVYFIKVNYSTNTVDPISSFVTLARGNNQALYNVAAGEESYIYPDSPINTEWNSEGGDLSNYASRTYTNFAYSLDGNVGTHILEKPLIMHDIDDDKYYLIQFHTWTQNNAGGGFSYTRLRLDDAVFFTKGNYDIGVSDNISEFVALTRGNNGGLYNPNAGEENYTYPSSPLNTEWNGDAGDLSDYTTRTYTTFVNALQSNVGLYILKTPLIMHDINDDKYYSIIFTSWTQNNNGGGFSYARILLNPAPINTTGKTFANYSGWGEPGQACSDGPVIIKKEEKTIVLYYNEGQNRMYTDAGFQTAFNGGGFYWWDQTDNQSWLISGEGYVSATVVCK